MLSVSVIVPSYQGAARLPLLLDHFSQQQTERNWELIVVLDGSTDSSAEILASWSNRLPLKIINRSENKGRSATLNEGFAAATGDVLIRCDDDLLPSENYVETFAALIEDEPSNGVTGLYRNIFPENRYARIYGRDVDERHEKEALAFPKEKRWALWAGNCAVSKEIWEQVGPYDEDFREYGWEDVDWGFRLMECGHEILVSPDLSTPHRLASTSASQRLGRAHQSGKARIKFLRKHHIPYNARDLNTWNKLVNFTAHFSGKTWGHFLDKLLYVLPKVVASKLIDMGVEAAFLRGEKEALKA